MSLYNRGKVINFLQTNYSFLIGLNKFRGISLNDYDGFINLMKLTKNNVDMLTNIFEIRQIPPNHLFCSATAEQNHVNVGNKKPDEFKEFHFDKDWHGTMYLTSDYNTGNTNRNLGSRFNISIVTTFLGLYDDYLGRILMFKNKYQLNMLYLGDNSFQGRRLFSQIATKLILGADYYLEKTDGSFTHLSKMCQNCQNYSYIMNDCVCGVWSGYGTLPEFVINYFFEIYCYDNKYPLFDGIIDLDYSYDKILKKKIFGTEYRIFIAENHFTLESVLYMGKIYYNATEYYNVINTDFNNYKMSGTNAIKHWSLNDFQLLLDQLNDYANKRKKLGVDKNVFNMHSVFKYKDINDIKNILLVGGKHKYVIKQKR